MHLENFWNASYMAHFSWFGLLINIYYFSRWLRIQDTWSGGEIGKLPGGGAKELSVSVTSTAFEENPVWEYINNSSQNTVSLLLNVTIFFQISFLECF